MRLPSVSLYWYDGYDADRPGISASKPDAEIMGKVVKSFGEIPNTGCYIIGSRGDVLMQDDYGGLCSLSLKDEEGFVDVFSHEAARQVPRSIPFCSGSESAVVLDKSTVEMEGFAEGHYTEFVNAIRGEGPVYGQTHSRCFSDIEYCIPQMEGILIGCVAQRASGRLVWDAASQRFDSKAANALIRPYVREGWEF